MSFFGIVMKIFASCKQQTDNEEEKKEKIVQ
jgi:hypothetical protein